MTSNSYAGGHISLESAWRVAYFRGICSRDLILCAASADTGAMMSVGLPEPEVEDMITSLNAEACSFGISIACINSPNNITVAGESRLINKLKTQLDDMGIFARKLRVPVAYHSKQMHEVARKYRLMIKQLTTPQPSESSVPMISSVTGRRAETQELTSPAYWATNMNSTVLFTKAVTKMCEKSEIVKKIDRSHLLESVVDHLIEIGPHATLQAPLRDILQATSRGKSISYNSILRRNQCAIDTLLSAIGHLHCIGYPVNLRAVNTAGTCENVKHTALPSLLVDLPEYPFDHSQRYWEESRLSKNYRLRSHPPTSLLGVRSRDWNPSETQWRLIIRKKEMPWTEQHVVNGLVLYPASGMLVLAIEAAKQLTEEKNTVHGYSLRDVVFESPIDVGSATGQLEVQTHLHEVGEGGSGTKAFEFTIGTWTNEAWLVNCRGFICAEISPGSNNWVQQKNIQRRRGIADRLEGLRDSCTESVDAELMYDFLKQHGFDYGPDYRSAQEQFYNPTQDQARATVEVHKSSEDKHVIHPVSLDAILHLTFTAFSSGGSRPMATSVPHRIASLWISSKGLSRQDGSFVSACTAVKDVSAKGFSCTGGALSSDPDRQLLIWYDGFELVNITSKEPLVALLPNPKQFCMGVEYKVALDKLPPAEIRRFLCASHPITEDQSTIQRNVRLLIQTTLKELLERVDLSGLELQEPWKRNYLNWARFHLKEQSSPIRLLDNHHSLQNLKENISASSRMGRVYVEVASNLIAIFEDEAYPLELLFESGLLRDGYQEWAEYDCAKQAARYLDLLAHQQPGMNILEVGGGTGATTRNFTNALQVNASNTTRSLRCKRYDFTDVSAVLVEKARDEFANMAAQMTFKTLDIEKAFDNQGFEKGSYDVIVADNVLHVTSDLERTLRNVRKVFRPGGKLILHELLIPTGWTAGFIFGVFPGWWLGVEDGRKLSPNLAPEQWDKVLKASGFSGVDITLVDSESNDTHQLGWLVATAIEEQVAVSPRAPFRLEYNTILLMDESSEQQRTLYHEILFALSSLFESPPKVASLKEIADRNIEFNGSTLVISILDYGPSFLASLDETRWKRLCYLIQKSHRMLWVSAGGGRGASPEHGLLDGFARTLRSEYYNLHLVTVALESSRSECGKGEHLSKIVREMLERPPHQNYEQDYTEFEGMLYTRRLVEANHLKSSIDERVVPYRVEPTTVGGKHRFKASTSSGLGSPRSPYYVEDCDLPPATIAADFVEIAVRAVYLQSEDRIAYLEQDENSKYGSHCSGVVVRAGSNCSLIPGDHVIATHPESFRSHISTHHNRVAKISTALSFADACHSIPRIASAYAAYMQVGTIKYGESVLVHDGASHFGRVLLQLLKNKGVTDLWTTADDEDECKKLQRTLQFPDEKILPKSWLENHSSFRMVEKQKFDVVFSGQASTSHPVLDYVNIGGRFVQFGSNTRVAQGRRTISSAPTNIHLISVPSSQTDAEALAYAASVSSSLSEHSTDSLEVYPASELTTIFSNLKRLPDGKAIVVRLDQYENLLVSYGSIV